MSTSTNKLALLAKAAKIEYRSNHQRPDLWLAELIADARRLPREDTIEVYEAALIQLVKGSS